MTPALRDLSAPGDLSALGAPSVLADLGARRARGERAVAAMAAAPVRHVPPAFLAALTCLDAVAEDRDRRWPVLRLAR
jgi:hypothetical protein